MYEKGESRQKRGIVIISRFSPSKESALWGANTRFKGKAPGYARQGSRLRERVNTWTTKQKKRKIEKNLEWNESPTTMGPARAPSVPPLCGKTDVAGRRFFAALFRAARKSGRRRESTQNPIAPRSSDTGRHLPFIRLFMPTPRPLRINPDGRLFHCGSPNVTIKREADFARLKSVSQKLAIQNAAK